MMRLVRTRLRALPKGNKAYLNRIGYGPTVDSQGNETRCIHGMKIYRCCPNCDKQTAVAHGVHQPPNRRVIL